MNSLLGTLRIVKVSEIIFDAQKRGRRDYGEIREFAKQLRSEGLINPLTVYSPTLEPPYELLAGGRRYMAIQHLEWAEVSVRIFDEPLSDDRLAAIELFENLHRKELTHVEEVRMKAKLHELLMKTHGKKLKRTADADGHSMTDTAKLLGESKARLSTDLKLARALDDYPELKLESARNKSAALKILERFTSVVVNHVTAEDVDKRMAAAKKVVVTTAPETRTITPPVGTPAGVEFTMNTEGTKFGRISSVDGTFGDGPSLSNGPKEVPKKNIADIRAEQLVEAYILGDFFENDLPDNSYSFIEIDPPYGIDIGGKRKAANKQVLHGEYREVEGHAYVEFLEDLIVECQRLSTANCWLVLWIGPQWYQTAIDLLDKSEFIANKIPGIWKKHNSPGQQNSPSTALGNAYEMFIYARRGRAQLRQQGRSNIFDFQGITDSRRIHPTERPRELMAEILSTFAWPRSNVLVPFAGSGVTLTASIEAGYTAVGFDLSREFRNAFVARTMREAKQLALV